MRTPALRHAESIPFGPSIATALLLWSLAGCAAAALREAGIAEVGVATLREDWRGPRDRAERGIRAAVDRMGRRWSRVVVIPYRLFGFGPYAGVLEGLDYVGAEGLLPHPLVSDWVAARATATFCAAGMASPLGPCYAAHPQRSR